MDTKTIDEDQEFVRFCDTFGQSDLEKLKYYVEYQLEKTEYYFRTSDDGLDYGRIDAYEDVLNQIAKIQNDEYSEE